MIKEYSAPFIKDVFEDKDLDSLSILLDSENKQAIDNLLWSNNGYAPLVHFSLAHTSSSIVLKFFVSEKYVQAVYTAVNDPVYKDSCVEFFIAFGNDSSYYNLEFNSIGTPQVGYGPGKQREYLPVDVIRKINSKSNIAPLGNIDGFTEWHLTLQIPFEVFIHHDFNSLKNTVNRGNFYKCGDDLPEPHFLSWSNIDNPQPNFHLPAFFGQIKFI